MKRLLISFSGGKTSAYMAVRILKELAPDYDEVKVVFANTGCEHEKTLEYVDAIDRHYGLGVVWVESVPQQGRKPTGHKLVDFATAARDGAPFEAVIAKYGLPNQKWPHCTRETKLNPIKSYLASIGWKPGSYKTATGIRLDEMDRISSAPHIIHPLIGWRVTKATVQAWDAAAPVRLGLPEHLGNCVWCWKKSFRKLGTIMRENPRAFDFPERMEREHAYSGKQLLKPLIAQFAGYEQLQAPTAPGRQIFRNNALTSDIVALASNPAFEPYVDGSDWRDDLDTGGSCGESCEIGGD